MPIPAVRLALTFPPVQLFLDTSKVPSIPPFPLYKEQSIRISLRQRSLFRLSVLETLAYFLSSERESVHVREQSALGSGTKVPIAAWERQFCERARAPIQGYFGRASSPNSKEITDRPKKEANHEKWQIRSKMAVEKTSSTVIAKEMIKSILGVLAKKVTLV